MAFILNIFFVCFCIYLLKIFVDHLLCARALELQVMELVRDVTELCKGGLQ